MSSSKVFTQAICLRQSDWSETSQIATLLTRDHGVIRAIAKGSRRWNAPFSGGIEVLTRGEAGIFLKPARELQLIGEWDLQETFPAGRHAWKIHCMHLLASEVALRLVPAGPESHHPFDSMLALLRHLESHHAQTSPAWWLTLYLWHMLEHAGHAPDLATAFPSTKPNTSDVAHFAPELGRWLEPHERAGTTWAMRRETLTLLSQVAQASLINSPATAPDNASPSAPPAHLSAPLSAPPRSTERAARFLVAFLEYVSGQEIRTAGNIFSDNPI